MHDELYINVRKTKNAEDICSFHKYAWVFLKRGDFLCVCVCIYI